MSSDLVNDLQDAFEFYDHENKGYISITHFRNIMQNFGYHMHIRDANEELKKVDSQFLHRNCVDLQFVKEAIAYRMYKGSKDSTGRDEEARDCFNLFDKHNKDKEHKDRINYQQIKQTLAPHLKFQVSESDIQEFMEFVGHDNGLISYKDFTKFYLS